MQVDTFTSFSTHSTPLATVQTHCQVSETSPSPPISGPLGWSDVLAEPRASGSGSASADPIVGMLDKIRHSDPTSLPQLLYRSDLFAGFSDMTHVLGSVTYFCRL